MELGRAHGVDVVDYREPSEFICQEVLHPRGEYEGGHRYEYDYQEGDPVVDPAVLFEGHRDARDHAQRQGDHKGIEVDVQCYGDLLSYDGPDRNVGVHLKGDAPVPVDQDVAHVDEILNDHRLVKIVFGVQLGHHFGGHLIVTLEDAARHQPYDDESDGQYDEQCDHRSKQTLKDILRHKRFLSVSAE